ncbi:flp pilus assembly protein CpaB [Neobacillus piezotolerans]|uniref:Flp pilus assembly protein CpaB n=1 Tax=Neobacillus piezotolerans TaxID=2259171 RepID=A0A3D8GJW8_9BACI|nr:SAF domain-containing protein [Neobacillus piezotolerans]RDU34744.1 flp pilus assembly protein CpaB [Neobacillus piezotolerans]
MLESKRRAIIFFVLALLLALIAGFLVLKKVQALNSDLGTMAEVFVAREDISSRTLITPNNVKKEEIPRKYLRSYHVVDVRELQNKVSVVPLSKGDIITKNVLKQASAVVEENNRLITLMSSDRVFFDEPLEALDRVDIIVSHKFDSEEKTEIFMKDVKVARVAKRKNEFQGVQVEVPLEKAPELIHMQNYSDSVRIVKANVGKEEMNQGATQGEKPTDGKDTIQVPAKPPAVQQKPPAQQQKPAAKPAQPAGNNPPSKEKPATGEKPPGT